MPASWPLPPPSGKTYGCIASCRLCWTNQMTKQMTRITRNMTSARVCCLLLVAAACPSCCWCPLCCTCCCCCCCCCFYRPVCSVALISDVVYHAYRMHSTLCLQACVDSVRSCFDLKCSISHMHTMACLQTCQGTVQTTW